MYVYHAEVLRVVDGDTVDFKVDLGFYMSAHLRFRILGVDTPELRRGTEEEKQRARDAKEFVELELRNAQDITLYTEKADGFGRWLADVVYTAEDLTRRCLRDELIDNGHGVEYDR